VYPTLMRCCLLNLTASTDIRMMGREGEVPWSALSRHQELCFRDTWDKPERSQPGQHIPQIALSTAPRLSGSRACRDRTGSRGLLLL
jgi:hypothetical protein